MLWAFQQGNTKNWFDEADEEIKERLEKKRSCHNRLLAKPNDQAAKAAYKTVCVTYTPS